MLGTDRRAGKSRALVIPDTIPHTIPGVSRAGRRIAEKLDGSAPRDAGYPQAGGNILRRHGIEPVARRVKRPPVRTSFAGIGDSPA